MVARGKTNWQSESPLGNKVAGSAAGKFGCNPCDRNFFAAAVWTNQKSSRAKFNLRKRQKRCSGGVGGGGGVATEIYTSLWILPGLHWKAMQGKHSFGAKVYNSANQAFQFGWEPWTLGLHRNFPPSWTTRVCTVWHKWKGRFSFWFWGKRARLPGETARHCHQILNFLPLSRCLAGFGQIHQIWKQFHIEKKRTP